MQKKYSHVSNRSQVFGSLVLTEAGGLYETFYSNSTEKSQCTVRHDGQ